MLTKDVIIAGVKFGIILRTTDGGATWDSTLVDTDKECLALSFADSVHGALFYLWEENILLTDDGGETWYEMDTPAIKDYHLKYNIGDIDMITHSIIIMSYYRCEENLLYTIKTTDKGNTWNISESINPNYS